MQTQAGRDKRITIAPYRLIACFKKLTVDQSIYPLLCFAKALYHYSCNDFEVIVSAGIHCKVAIYIARGQ